MPFWGPRNDANALRLGRIFAGQVLEALERIEVTDQTTLAGARMIVDLPVRSDWSRLLQAEQARLAQEFASVQVQNPVLSPILEEGADPHRGAGDQGERLSAGRSARRSDDKHRTARSSRRVQKRLLWNWPTTASATS